MGADQRATAALLAGIVLTITLAAGSAALAASPKGQQPGGHLKLSEVFVDFTNDTILITGEDFDFGPGPLTVTLGDPDLIAAGSIVCTPDFTALPQTIECDFFTPGLPGDGDYLLTVATGAGQSQSDEYDLTIGAVGPEGPQGPPGSTGTPTLPPTIVVSGPNITLSPGSSAIFSRSCPASHPKLLSGGWRSATSSLACAFPLRILSIRNFQNQPTSTSNWQFGFHHEALGCTSISVDPRILCSQ